MILYNGSNKTQQVHTSRYHEQLKGFTSASKIPEGTTVNDLKQFTLPAHGSLILELKP